MAFEEKTEPMVCPDCNVINLASWSRQPFREWTKVDCVTRGSTIFSGKDVRDFHTVRLAPTGYRTP